MRKTVVSFIILFIAGTAFARNEILNAYFFSRYSVINSSCLGGDSAAILINPASLNKLDRVNMVIATGSNLDAHFIGASATFSYVGSIGLGLYNIPTFTGGQKQGLFLGWGKELVGFLSAGLNMKTVASEIGRFDQGILFDAGLLFYPNQSLGEFFGNKWLNNRLFFGAVFQNVGVHAPSDIDESMNLRLGLAYDFQEIFTKFYVEKNLVGDYQNFVFGLELEPLFRRKSDTGDENDYETFKIFSLRAAYDTVDNDFKLGLALHGNDFQLATSYSFNRNEIFFALNGYFERSRGEIANELYEKGLSDYREGQKLERTDQDTALESFRSAYNRFGLALYYDKNHESAAKMRAETDSKMQNYLGAFVAAAKQYEAKGWVVSALIYYNKASFIEKTPEVEEKRKELSTNTVVVKEIEKKKGEIAVYIEKNDFKNAKKELDYLESIIPGNRDIVSRSKEISGKMQSKAAELYQKAKPLYNAGNYKQCLALLDEALSYYPEYSDAQSLYVAANGKYLSQRYLGSAETYYNRADYISALNIVNRILKNNPRDREALELKSKTVQKLQENIPNYLSRGKSYFSNGKYQQSIAEFDKILAVDPRHSIAREYKERAQKKLQAIKQLESIGD